MICTAHFERLGEKREAWIPSVEEAEQIARRLIKNQYKGNVSAASVIEHHREACMCRDCHDGKPIDRAREHYGYGPPNEYDSKRLELDRQHSKRKRQRRSARA